MEKKAKREYKSFIEDVESSFRNRSANDNIWRTEIENIIYDYYSFIIESLVLRTAKNLDNYL